VRLATFNILHGRSPEDGRFDLDRFADAVAQLDADVLALQEVDRAQSRSSCADLTAVAAEAMGAVAYRFVAALAGTPGATWSTATGQEPADVAGYGIALLSRYPTTWGDVVRLPTLRRRAPLLVPGRRRPILVRDEPRVGMRAQVSTPIGTVSVTTTHLSFIAGWNVVQLTRLARGIGRATPAVLLGDLNMQPWLATRASGLRALTAQPTYPQDRPTRQLDHILARGLGPATAARACRLPVSDHRALVVDC
jgi:endonuclease/exonuclease/phosphatase family metal-dependent hydrolase